MRTPAPAEFLRTERVVLREFTVADADLLVELDADPEVMRYLGPPSTPELVRDRVIPRVLGEYERGVPGWWIAESTTDGTFLGWFALATHKSPTPAQRELGYRLRRAAWGSGIATEVSRALVTAAFVEHEATSVWAETMAVNQMSRRVMTKVGLRHVRTEHRQFDDPLPGAEHGEVVYELTRAQWRSSGI